MHHTHRLGDAHRLTNDANRRKSPRIEVGGWIALEDATAHTTLTLLDVGAGGFLATGAAPYEAGTTAEFVFAGRDRTWSVRLAASAVHSHRRDLDGESVYATGFEFTGHESPDVQAHIEALIGRVIGTVVILS